MSSSAEQSLFDQVLAIGPRITALPLVHGSGDFAWQVRRILLQRQVDCLAVALPPSFGPSVEQAILALPTPSIVLQHEPSWNQSLLEDDPQSDEDTADDLFGDQGDDDDQADGQASYVPIDPCQGVIAAIREAMGEHIPRAYIDLEVPRYVPHAATMPDAYALKKVGLQQFAAAVLPFLAPPADPSWRRRIAHMAAQLRELSIDYRHIVLVCGLLEWPWIRAAYFAPSDKSSDESREATQYEPPPAQWMQVPARQLMFLLGEMPFITGLYENARQDLLPDEHLAIDGVKQLLLAARDAYHQEFGSRARKVTPHLLRVLLKYTRNLTLIENRLTPQLITTVLAAQQVLGDAYALHVLRRGNSYPDCKPLDRPALRLGIDRAVLPDGSVWQMKNRLAGPPVRWMHLELKNQSNEKQRKQWQFRWNPMQQCSWPPEDQLIEQFRRSVFDRAQQIMGQDLARTEKFTTSIKDGIDIRDTLRNWHTGDIYVKLLPSNRARLDAVVMLFDSPADPRRYPWRATWYAEHEEESTLAFFASDFKQNLVGPGIGLATYGGAMFLFPPRGIVDIWVDPELNFASTLEERLLAAACAYARCRQVALLAASPPGPAWRALARRFKKTLVHVPLSQFSDEAVSQLRLVHVLNGHHIRSFAANFIRRS